MSRETRDKVWAGKGFNGSHKLLLLALAEHADKSGVCWPGFDILIEKLDLSKSRIQGLLSDLECAGRIISFASGGRREGGYGDGQCPTYFVTSGLSEAEIGAVLVGHFRIELDSETADLLAKDTVSRVLNPRPLNRQTRVLNLRPKGAESKTARVLNPGAKGAESGTHINKAEPSRNRQCEPSEEEEAASSPPVLSAQEVSGVPPDIQAMQEITGQIYSIMSREMNRRFMDSINHLRQKAEPLPTPENIRLFGDLWKAKGRTKPEPHQVVRWWEDILSPPQRDIQNDQLQRNIPRPAFLTGAQRAEQIREQQRAELQRSFENH